MKFVNSVASRVMSIMLCAFFVYEPQYAFCQEMARPGESDLPLDDNVIASILLRGNAYPIRAQRVDLSFGQAGPFRYVPPLVPTDITFDAEKSTLSFKLVAAETSSGADAVVTYYAGKKENVTRGMVNLQPLLQKRVSVKVTCKGDELELGERNNTAGGELSFGKEIPMTLQPPAATGMSKDLFGFIWQGNSNDLAAST